MPSLNRYFSIVRKFVATHKTWSAIIAIVVVGGGYWTYGKLFPAPAQTYYQVGTVSRGTIIAAVSGSGQVSPSHQVTINPKASGTVTSVLVQNGQRVAAGQPIAYIDATDQISAVADAKANLQSAQLALQKLQEPADTLSLTQDTNALTQAQNALAKDYDDGYNQIASTFADLPNVVTGLKNILYGYDRVINNASLDNLDYYTNQTSLFDSRASSFHDDVGAKYTTAVTVYNSALDSYKTLSRSSSTSTISAMVDQTYNTSKDVADAVQSASNLIQLYKDALATKNLTPVSAADTHLASLNSYTSTISSDISSLLNIKTALVNDAQSVDEKSQTLAKLKAGADPLDVQSDQLTIVQRQNALQQAENTLADYTIAAPFSGTLANLNIHKGDTVSSGTSVATLITSDSIADLSLNEIDASKIAVGDTATLTFDAIDGLSLTGKVVYVSPLGAVSQGVVSYDVNIDFTTQDPRVKAGMTVNAEIQSAVHQNVLTVPASAVKTQSGASYVLVFQPPIATSTVEAAPTQGFTTPRVPDNLPVSIGISDDTNTEITSGLTEGEQVVTKTTSSSTGGAASAASRTTTTGAGGFRGGGAVIRGL